MTLAEFLEARIAEDERDAERSCTEIMQPGSSEPIRRIYPPDAVRMFKDCTAKRAIIAEHAPITDSPLKVVVDGAFCRMCVHPDGFGDLRRPMLGQQYPCKTVLAVAEVWSEHPHFGSWGTP